MRSKRTTTFGVYDRRVDRGDLIDDLHVAMAEQRVA